MATVNKNKTTYAAEVTAFGGIDASSPCGNGGIAVDMKNFKVLPDGSLCRRSGFLHADPKYSSLPREKVPWCKN